MDQHFLHLSATSIAIKIAVAVGIGMLIGMEREWSNKEAGIRTFAIVSLLGTLASVIGSQFITACLVGVFLLALLLNGRSIVVDKTVEITTSAVLFATYTLGVLVGLGHIFTPVAGAIIVMALLACKTELNRFTGGLRPSEIRSTILLGLIGLVIFPLMPDRYVDTWQLFNPHDAWAGIFAISGISFVNYIGLRLFRADGLFFSAFFGGLVNSTATIAELSSRAKENGLVHKLGKLCLTTIMSMFIRNLVIVAIISPASLVRILIPVFSMLLVSVCLIFWKPLHQGPGEGQLSLNLQSPIAVRKVLVFAALFLGIQIGGTLLTKIFGNYGILLAGTIGGFVSSASSTASAASLASHKVITASMAGAVAVISSLSSTVVNVPIVWEIVDDRPLRMKIILQMLAIIAIGALLMALEYFFQISSRLSATK
jgi:uncharacterized membrane protein (DUF4010 family)